MSRREKAAIGAQTLRDFCEQFGESLEGRILLDLLFEGLMNEEALFVSGQQEQAGSQIGDSAPERGDGERPPEQSGTTESSPSMGTEDLPDCP
jgi:hypothetical protein